MNPFKRFLDRGALLGAGSVYHAQRALGYSHESSLTTAGMYYAEMTGRWYKESRELVAAHLAAQANREIPGGSL